MHPPGAEAPQRPPIPRAPAPGPQPSLPPPFTGNSHSHAAERPLENPGNRTPVVLRRTASHNLEQAGYDNHIDPRESEKTSYPLDEHSNDKRYTLHCLPRYDKEEKMEKESSLFSAFSKSFANAKVASLVLGYAISSSILAIVNKYAVTVFPYPGALTMLQYLTCTVAVLLLSKMRLLEADPFTWEKLKGFAPAALVFYIAIFTNTKLLQYANVDTFIVFRSSTPILVAIADSVFLRRPWPSRATFASLLVILGGALAYVATDSQIAVRAYSWALAYLFTITFEMVYVKHIVSTIGLNTWGLVLYNNSFALFLSPFFMFLTGEIAQTAALNRADWLNLGTMLPVLLSCAFGLLISFFGFACRKAISATAFTVVGVTNKLLTVLINISIWDKHASEVGIFSLLVCMFGGVLYQQTTSGPPKAAAPASKVGKEGTLLGQATSKLSDSEWEPHQDGQYSKLEKALRAAHGEGKANGSH